MWFCELALMNSDIFTFLVPDFLHGLQGWTFVKCLQLRQCLRKEGSGDYVQRNNGAGLVVFFENDKLIYGNAC